ncbi:ABC transporter permease [Thalassospira sp. A3_1]|uniref:ABC transporter permease n=1 Tax=Thalassospira sp. A3_1 TaxID=2821088 RepID=UPI001ADA59DF|nr:ABC transporter permease [Thalassospira sp. A3_1]MBO9506227.1 ABC transporter permease [Thalassospira sp. A3_1]
MAKNDLRARYRGSMIGRLWLVVTPLAMLLLYSLVFSTIFKARWESLGAEVYGSYAIVLFPGLMMYQLMMDVLQKGGSAYDSYSPITTKLNISVLDLILGAVLASLIPFWITIGIWYLVICVMVGVSVQGVALVLLATIAFSIFCLGLALLSTVLGALVKDWVQVLSMFGMGILFISPVLYPIDHLPSTFQQIIYLNPLSHFVDVIREGAFQPEQAFSSNSLLPVLLMTVVSLALGIWFERVLMRFMHE